MAQDSPDSSRTDPDTLAPKETDLDSPEDVAYESRNPAASGEAPYSDAARGSGVNSGPNPDAFHDSQESKRRIEESRASGETHIPPDEAEETAPGDNLRSQR